MADTRPRHDLTTTRPVPRPTSSLLMVAAAVNAVHRAAAAADTAELRSALVDLSAESLVLACQPEPLPPSLADHRRTIAAESNWVGA